ncbi:MAG: hypothetical protein AAFZ63_03785 [Bacteroidota bacterium]
MQHLQIDTSKTVRLLYHLLGKVQPRLAEYVRPEDHFVRDWGFPPKDHSEYVKLLEQHFQIKIHEGDRQQMQSIQLTVDYLLRQANSYPN